MQSAIISLNATQTADFCLCHFNYIITFHTKSTLISISDYLIKKNDVIQTHNLIKA